MRQAMRLKGLSYEEARVLHQLGQTAVLADNWDHLKNLVAGYDDPTATETWQLRAITNDVSLALFRPERARQSLSPYLRAEKSLLSNDSVLEKLPDVGRAVILSQLGNLAYRSLQFDQGFEWTNQAAEIFSTLGSDTDIFQRVFARNENRIWRARVRMRLSGDRELAQEELEETAAELTLCYDDPDLYPHFCGRIDLQLSINLNLLALLAWNRGRLEEARRRIYRALYLTTRGNADDDIRWAHNLCCAARIEASHSTERFVWGKHLAEESATLFGARQHPFRYRSMIQAAQCSVKTGDYADGQKAIDEVRDLIDKDEYLRTNFDSEARYVEGEMRLTECWMREREAVRAHNSPARWEECHTAAQAIERAYETPKRMPNRLRIEAGFHIGRALVHLDGRVEDGRARLREAEKEAANDDRAKIQAACHLALAESYAAPLSREADPVQCRFHWMRAMQCLAEAPGASTFVSEWADRIGPAVGIASTISLEIEGKSQEDLEIELAYWFERFHTKVKGVSKVSDLEKLSKLPRATFYRKRAKAKQRHGSAADEDDE